MNEHEVASYPARRSWRSLDPGGRFRVIDAEASDGDVDVLRDGTPQYRLELRRHALLDFEPTCWWHQDVAEVALHAVARLLAAYREHFGIALDRVPSVRTT